MSISENSTLFPLRDNDESESAPDSGTNIRNLAISADVPSPYSDRDFVTIIVGSKRFFAHRTILAKSPELELKPFSKLWGDKANETITLPNIDEQTAHTLIHYLYSEKYELARLSNKEATDDAASGYRLGTCVYCSAIKYRLPGLAELAKEKIVEHGKDLNILKILSVAREHAFPLLPDEEIWFPSYLEDAVRAALLKDPTLLGAFASLMGGDKDADNKFRGVVLKAIASPFPAPTPLSQAETGVSTPAMPATNEIVAEDKASDEQTAIEEPEVVPESAQEEPTNEAALESSIAAEATPADIKPSEEIGEIGELKLEEVEPALSAPPQPEPYTDEVGFSASKTYHRQGKKPDSAVEKISDADPKPERPAHVRNDSVLQDTETSVLEAPVVPKVKSVASPEPAAEASPVIVDGTNGATTSKKKKKKGKKGSTSTAV